MRKEESWAWGKLGLTSTVSATTEIPATETGTAENSWMDQREATRGRAKATNNYVHVIVYASYIALI